jgi:peptide-methionine (S)-S-oxide reductase
MLQKEFGKPIITKVIPFKTFKLNDQQYLDYYYRNPEKRFAKRSLTRN